MNKKIGILGASGTVGRNVLKNLSNDLTIAGVRDRRKLDSCKQDQIIQFDIEEERQLRDFCMQCNTVINCIGNPTQFGDRFARICLDTNTNYVDVSGDDFLLKSLDKLNEQFLEKNLSCIHSAGVAPGLIEFIMHQYSKETDIDSLELYFCGNGELSRNAAKEMILSCDFEENQSRSYFDCGHIIQANHFMIEKKFDYPFKDMYCVPIITASIYRCLEGTTINKVYFYNTFKSQQTLMCLISAKMEENNARNIDDFADELVNSFSNDAKQLGHKLTQIYIITQTNQGQRREEIFNYQGDWNELTGVVGALICKALMNEKQNKKGVGEIWNTIDDKYIWNELLANDKIQMIK